MTPTFVLFEMQGQQVLVAEEAKSRGLRTVTLNHDPLRTSGPFAVRDGIIDENIRVASWSAESLVSGGKVQHVGLTGRNNQIDSVAWFAVTGASAAEAHRKALSARAETVFNGAPMGDDPPLICPRHLTADLAVS
jgi:hypothetical protein